MMRDSDMYLQQAAHFREVAAQSDPVTAEALMKLAEEYEAEAFRLRPDLAPRPVAS